MTNTEFMEKVQSLPAKQQIALWVILKNFYTEKGTWFTASDFAEKGKKFLASEEKESARILGGILSSMVRNGVIKQLTGGRKPVWQVMPEMQKHASEYQKILHPVVTYWESSDTK